MTESRLPGSQAQTTSHELQWKEKSVPEKSVGDSRGRSSGLNHRPRRESLSVKPQDSRGDPSPDHRTGIQGEQEGHRGTQRLCCGQMG